MKKTLLFFATAFAFGTARAQVSIIPRGGLTFSTISFKETVNFISDPAIVGPIAGFASGIGFNIPLAKDGVFSVQPELLYVQKGYRYDVKEPWIDFQAREQFNYLEVPVLARLTLGIGKFKIYANAGPSLAYGLNGQNKFIWNTSGRSSTSSGKNIFRNAPNGYSWGDDNKYYYDPKYYNRFDLGGQFGGGVGFSIGPGDLLLDARYGLGLSHFYKGDKSAYNNTYPITDRDPNVKNRVFALTLGYAIPLGSK